MTTTDMHEMSDQELIQLINRADTLLANVTRKTGLRLPEEQSPQAVATNDDFDSDGFDLDGLDLDELDRIEDILKQHHATMLSTSRPNPPKGNPLDRFDGGSSRWTERQHGLIWWYETFGVIGLAYKVKEIAKAEITKAAGLEPTTPKFYRKRIVPTKRSHQSANVEVENSQVEEEEEEEEEEDEDEDGTDRPQTLSDELQSLIDAHGPGHRSWRRMYYDWYRGSHSRMLFYLSSIPDEVMRAILHGDLPNRMSEPSFARRNGALVTLSQNPGTYTLYIARTKTWQVRHEMPPTPSPEESSEALSLSLEEIMEFCNVATRYIDVDDTEYVESAKLIDSAIGKFQGRINYSFQRRYGASADKNNFTTHRAFVKKLTDEFADWTSALRDMGREDALRIPLRRCFAHVGLSSNPLSRCPTHWTHGSVPSPIFGMVTAILQALWPGRFDVTQYSYQIFRAVHFEELGFAEILSTIISSAYYWDLGLSHTYAGNRGPADEESEQFKSKFVENAQCIWNEKVQVEQVGASIAKLEGIRTIWRQDIDEMQRVAGLEKDSLGRTCTSLRKTKDALETARLGLQVEKLQNVLCDELGRDGYWG